MKKGVAGVPIAKLKERMSKAAQPVITSKSRGANEKLVSIRKLNIKLPEAEALVKDTGIESLSQTDSLEQITR